MSLGCNIKEIKENAFTGIQKLVETKTITMNSDGFINTNSSDYSKALTIQNKIKDFISKNIGEKFNLGWTSITEKEGNVGLQYTFPKYVENAYNRKFTIEEGRQQIESEVTASREIEHAFAEDAGVPASEFQGTLYFQYEDNFDSLMDPDVQDKLDNSIPNDFSSYIKHKNDLLKKLEDKYESYKRLNKSNYGTDKYKTDSYNFQNTITKLKDEIENLNPDDSNVVFQDVINEMNYLSGLLDTTDTEILGNQDVINRIDFLNQMITGQNLNGELVNYDIWNGDSFFNYDKTVAAGLIKLTNKLKLKERAIIQDIMAKDIIFTAHKENFTEEEIQSLFEKRADINILQDLFLGINSNNDTIAATLLNTTFQTNVQKTKQYAREFNENIKSLDKKLKEKGFDLDKFLEKDDQDIDTGLITHKYTKEYFKKLYEYYELNRNFNQSKKEGKKNAYDKKIAWLKNNAAVIDFRKLKYFKDLYQDQYGEHFTSTDEEMSRYEFMLRENLGKIYDYHIQDLEKKLAEYEDYKTTEELKDTKWLGKNINTNSPWVFLNNYFSENPSGQVSYGSGANTYFTYNNSKYIEYSPIKNRYNVDTEKLESTGYFNDNFDEIENDSDAFAYWENMRDVYSKHINPTYSSTGQNISSLSWAKFERSWREELSASKGVLDFVKTAYYEAIKSFKQAWYERGYFTDKTNIKSNYTDVTSKEITKLKKFLILESIEDLQLMATQEGIKYDNLAVLTKNLSTNEKTATEKRYKEDLIDKIARKKVFAEYSKDLTKTTLALSDLASLHKARQETQFIADMLLNYHKTIKDGKNKDRNTSNKKLQSWVSTNIYNNRAVSRGNEEDSLGNELVSLPKLYSETEKQLLTILKGLNSGATNTDRYSFYVNGVNYSKKDNGYYTGIEGSVKKTNKEDFENALAMYINEEIQRLGIHVTPGSIGLGIMKTIINKALALNPISGIFNRVDGLFANTIRDNMGDYWTQGNLKFSKRFMALANINKFAGNKMGMDNKRKALQMKTYQSLLDELALFQDKKNELDRKDKESKFSAWSDKLNIFQFAVDNPEFKNQGEIVLSMLMDVIIKDNAGNDYKFFDGTGFPAYKPGTLELNDNFKNEANQGWEDFHINTENPELNDFFVAKLKIEDTIKKTQGNYASLDSIRILDNNWGKFMMLFMRWMPEHINQRFGSRSVDIVQGKKKIAGRYRGLLRNAGATTVFATIALGVGLGPVGLGIGLTAGALIPFIMQKWGKKYVNGDDSVKNHLLDMSVTVGFMKEILIQSMNLPLKVGYGDKNLDNIIQNNRLNKNQNLNKDEQAALKGMAQEVAIMLTQLTTLILLKSLLWDDDDNEDDFRRQFHNFVDNQANRSIGNMLNWSNPKTFIEENSKLAMLRYIGDIEKLIKHTGQYFVQDKGTPADILYDFTKVQPVIPVPNTVSKGLMKGEYPGADKKEYQGNQWFDSMVKGEEYNNKKVLKNRRSQFKAEYEEILRQKYEGKDIDPDVLDDLIDKKARRRMNKYDVKKRKSETATEALERIDFDEEAEEDASR